MLNVLTKYSTMVTDGSTGSTSYVPMMPRAKGFCITTHKKRTQKAGKQLCLLVYLRGNKKAAAFNCAPPCALRAVINAKREMAAQREKSALLPSALFFGGHSDRQFHTDHQKICCIGMAIATKTTGFLLLSRCPFLYLPLFSAFSASLPFSRPIPSLYWTAGQPDQLTAPPTPPTDHTVSRDDQQGELASVVDHQLMSVKGYS